MTIDENGKTALRIDGDMTIYRAHELMQQLLEAFGRSANVEIDLSGVTELDTAGLQLLMLAKKVAQANSTELHLTRHSPAVLDVFELLDLAPFFGDQLVIQPSS